MIGNISVYIQIIYNGEILLHLNSLNPEKNLIWFFRKRCIILQRRVEKFSIFKSQRSTFYLFVNMTWFEWKMELTVTTRICFSRIFEKVLNTHSYSRSSVKELFFTLPGKWLTLCTKILRHFRSFWYKMGQN